jgi:hypothetical protein
MRFRINAALQVKDCDVRGWLLSQVSGTAEYWHREHDFAVETSMPKWGIDRLGKSFEKCMLTPIRNAALVRETDGKHGSSMSMLRADMRSLLLEYISVAPLVSEVADRGRNALSLLSTKLAAVSQIEVEESKTISESDGRVEEVWRDLLVEWVSQLLTEKPKVKLLFTHFLMSIRSCSSILLFEKDSDSPSYFVTKLSNAATRMRRIHDTSPLPPGAKLLDRRAFANA